jgi:hypothetical protein
MESQRRSQWEIDVADCWRSDFAEASFCKTFFLRAKLRRNAEVASE